MARPIKLVQRKRLPISIHRYVHVARVDWGTNGISWCAERGLAARCLFADVVAAHGVPSPMHVGRRSGEKSATERR